MAGNTLRLGILPLHKVTSSTASLLAAFALTLTPTLGWAAAPVVALAADATPAEAGEPDPFDLDVQRPNWRTRGHVLDSELAPAADRHEALAWFVVVGGAAVGLAGAGLGIAAALSRADLEAQWVRSPKTGLIESMTYEQALSRRDAIHTERLAAIALGCAGAGVATVGAWLLWRAYGRPAKSTAWSPSAGGLALRF